MCIYIYIHTYINIHTCIFIHTHIYATVLLAPRAYRISDAQSTIVAEVFVMSESSAESG